MKKDKEIIDQLHLLQSVQPDKRTLRLIRGKIPSQVEADKGFVFKRWFTMTPFAPVISFVMVVIIFFVAVTIFPYAFTNMQVNLKIALASNHYEKAKIALANVHAQLPELKENPSNANKIALFSQSLSLANNQMSGLQLSGEKGKYTSYQCEELYQSYHDDLGQIEHTVRFNKSKDVTILSSQVGQYNKQAQIKLKNYKNKNWNDNESK